MNSKRHFLAWAPTLLAASGFVAAPAWAERIHAKLDSFQENLQALSTPASGSFRAKLDRRDQTIAYELNYSGIESGVLQAHIHFGQRWQNGGISVFLCANGTLKPNPGVPDCPANGGTVSGVVGAADVIGPTAQGIAAGEFDELLDAIKEGATYVNVHSTTFPGGEIRGQIR